MNRIFVDTSFIVALINERDTHHKQAISLGKRFIGRPLLTTDGILLETGNSLSRTHNHKAQAITIFEKFLTADEIEIVHLTPQLFRKGLGMYKRYQDKSWGLVDCISFVVMRESGIDTALTLDRHFVQAGFRILMH